MINREVRKMIPTSVVLSLVVYAFISSITPGPGNILALNTVSNYGIEKGKKLFLGIFAGNFLVQCSCAVVVFALAALLPKAMGIMKYIGAAYVVFLAVQIVLSKRPAEAEDKPASFWKGLALQLVNAKIYIFGVTALTGYITEYSKNLLTLLVAEVLIAAIGSLCTTAWIFLGSILKSFYEKHFRAVNIVMSLTLGECVYSMLVA